MKSDWMRVSNTDRDYLEINFLPDDPPPKQIRIWVRESENPLWSVEACVEIIRTSPSEERIPDDMNEALGPPGSKKRANIYD